MDSRHILAALHIQSYRMDAEVNCTKGQIRMARLVRKDFHVMKSWEDIILSQTVNISTFEIKKDLPLIYLMSIVILFVDVFSDTYKIYFQDVLVKNIGQDIEGTNFLEITRKLTMTFMHALQNIVHFH